MAIAVTSAAAIRTCRVPTVRDPAARIRVDNWQACWPAGTANLIVEKIGRSVMAVFKTPELKSRMASVGFEPRGDGPDAVVEIIRTSLPKWAEVIRRSGLKLSE